MLKVFSIFDVKAGIYSNPFYCVSAGIAHRSFIETLSDPSCPFAKFPADFSLYYLGSFDETTGMFVSLQRPELIVTAATVIAEAYAPRADRTAYELQHQGTAVVVGDK